MSEVAVSPAFPRSASSISFVFIMYCFCPCVIPLWARVFVARIQRLSDYLLFGDEFYLDERVSVP